MAVEFLAGAAAAVALIVCVYLIVVKMESAGKRSSKIAIEPSSKEHQEEQGSELENPIVPIPGRVIDIRKGRSSKRHL